MSSLSGRLKYYGDNTTLHGIRYVSDENRHPVIRLMWIVVFVLSFVCMLRIFKGIYNSYDENAISFVTETAYLNWNTTFPAITICEITGSEVALDEESDDDDIDADDLEQFVNDIIFFTGSCYSCNMECSICEKFNFTQLVQKYRKRCPALLKSCKWNGKPFECCEKFQPLETEYGVCYSLNSIHTRTKNPNQELLHSNRRTGPGNVVVETTQDVRLYFHAIEDVPFINSNPDHRKDVMLGEIHNISVKVECNKETLQYGHEITVHDKNLPADGIIRKSRKNQIFHRTLEVLLDDAPNNDNSTTKSGSSVIEIENDENVKYIPVEKRGCRFPWEKPADLIVHEFYSYSACVVQCHAESHFRLCNCTHHHMPYYKALKYCDIEGLQCLTDNFETVNRLHAKGFDKPGLVCECLPSCVEPEYKVVADTKGVRASFSEISVKMQSLPTSRFKRIVVRTQMDLVVSIGGAAGLFIGASILSIVETVYLLILRRK